MRTPLLLVHGGIAEKMDADRFWRRPGITQALIDLGWQTNAPDRDTTPSSWHEGATQVAAATSGPAVVVAGSNGCSIALRMAIDHPQCVERLVLLWPATAGDLAVDERVDKRASHLLAGDTIRGVADAELADLSVSVSVMAAEPESPFHQHVTVDRLIDLVPAAARIDGSFPEPPHPDFVRCLDRFVTALVPHLG